MTKHEIQYVDLDSLKPADRNAKNHADSVIEDSINRFGYVESIVVDGRTGKIVAGHGRLDTLKRLRDAGEAPPEGISKDWKVPVTAGWSSKNDQEAEAYLIASNRTTELGGWVDGVLVDSLKALDDLTGMGYSLDELAGLIESNTVPNFAPVADSDMPRLDEKEPVTCPSCGYQWQKD